MGLPKFTRPKGHHDELCCNLYVANCGPAVGLAIDSITSAFSKFGTVKGVYPADESGSRVIVSYYDENSAQSALKALDRCPCPDLGGRSLHIRYSVQQPQLQVVATDSVQVCLEASELNIPGIYLIHDFVSAQEEEQLLATVDARPWHSLAKRRVQHYGYEFCYDIRNVNTQHRLGNLPSFVDCILEKIPVFKKLDEAADVSLDQLTGLALWSLEGLQTWMMMMIEIRKAQILEEGQFICLLDQCCCFLEREDMLGNIIFRTIRLTR